MSQKTSYKARVQKAIVLQDFRRALAELNPVHALHIFTSNAYIPEDEFRLVFEEVSEVPWRWHNLIRG